MNEPQVIADMLGRVEPGSRTHRPITLAVVGLSDNPARPSFAVSAYMQRHGYRIRPVNPALLEAGVSEVLGEPVYPSLAALPEPPEVVNVFRLARFLPAIVDEMIALGLRRLWVQQGIVNADAAAHAEAHGIAVVMDRCVLVEHRRLGLE